MDSVFKWKLTLNGRILYQRVVPQSVRNEDTTFMPSNVNRWYKRIAFEGSALIWKRVKWISIDATQTNNLASEGEGRRDYTNHLNVTTKLPIFVPVQLSIVTFSYEHPHDVEYLIIIEFHFIYAGHTDTLHKLFSFISQMPQCSDLGLVSFKRKTRWKKWHKYIYINTKDSVIFAILVPNQQIINPKLEQCKSKMQKKKHTHTNYINKYEWHQLLFTIFLFVVVINL